MEGSKYQEKQMKLTVKKLRDKLVPLYGDRETEAIIRIIFHHLKGWDTTQMLIHGEQPLSPFIISEIEKILQRLLRYEPIQYITGEARFHGMEMKVTRDVLIPRPETDELVDLIIKDYNDKPDLNVLDIGTGSGCIAIALSRNLKFATVSAVDISAKALDVAKENASRMKVKINFMKKDIFSWSPDNKFDIIVSNPPYICRSETDTMDQNVVMYEPHEALFVPDSDPLLFYRRIAEIAVQSLLPNGSLYLEINPLHSAELKSLLISKGLKEIEIIRDFYGKYRFIKATNKNQVEI